MKPTDDNLPMFATLPEAARLCGRSKQHVERLIRRTVGFDGLTSANGLLIRLDKLPSLRVIAAGAMRPKPGRAGRIIC